MSSILTPPVYPECQLFHLDISVLQCRSMRNIMCNCSDSIIAYLIHQKMFVVLVDQILDKILYILSAVASTSSSSMIKFYIFYQQ